MLPTVSSEATEEAPPGLATDEGPEAPAGTVDDPAGAGDDVLVPNTTQLSGL